MNIYKCLLSGMYCFLVFSSIIASQPDTFIVGSFPTRDFFAIFLGALNNIAWCVNNQKIPVIYWGPECCFNHDTDCYNNAWDIYFEPLSQENVIPTEASHYGYRAPDGSGLTYADYLQMIDNRYYLHELINRYIKIKPAILQEVDDYFNEHMKGKKIIGIYLPSSIDARDVSVKKIIEYAEQYKKDGYQFFVATNSFLVLKIGKKLLGEDILSYDSYAVLEYNILIQILLLSRCDYLIHIQSRTAISAYFFNPQLPGVMLRATQPPIFVGEKFMFTD